MKLIVDVKKEKMDFVLELLRNFSFVKTVEAFEDDEQEAVEDNIKIGLQEVRLFKEGKLKTTPAKAFLDEL